MSARRRPIVLTFRIPARAKRAVDRLAVEVLLRRPSLSLEEARGVVLARVAREQLRDHRARRASRRRGAKQ